MSAPIRQAKLSDAVQAYSWGPGARAAVAGAETDELAAACELPGLGIERRAESTRLSVEVPYDHRLIDEQRHESVGWSVLRADTRTVLCVDIADTSEDAIADATVAALADLSAAFHGTEEWAQVRDAAIATEDTPAATAKRIKNLLNTAIKGTAQTDESGDLGFGWVNGDPSVEEPLASCRLILHNQLQWLRVHSVIGAFHPHQAKAARAWVRHLNGSIRVCRVHVVDTPASAAISEDKVGKAVEAETSSGLQLSGGLVTVVSDVPARVVDKAALDLQLWAVGSLVAWARPEFAGDFA